MNTELIETTLGQVCERITDGSHSSPPSVSEGVPMASVKDLTRHGINFKSCRHISRDHFDQLVTQGCAPRLGDVLIAKDGNSALETVCVHRSLREVVLLSSVAILRPGGKIESDFLRYFLESPSTKYILKGGYVSGSAIPRVVLKDFKMVPILIPPISEQKEIARILGTLDDKIELNRKTNETLEEIAKALFKSWFVDFDPVRAKAEGRPTGLPAEISDLFPDSFEDSELGQIPSGWEIKAISNLCQSISSGGTPSRKNSEYWIGGTISWFKTGELRDSFLLESEERITQAGLNESSCKYFDKGDILFALYGATVGKMGIVTAPSTANQAAACLRPLEEVGTPFLEGMLYATRERLMNIATGAAQQNLYLGVVKEHAVVAPCKPLPKMFSQLVEPINQRRLCCLKESSSLSSFGNALLPKLISGEIRIPDAEKMLEEVDI